MTHHRRGLRRLLSDDDLLLAIEQDWRTAGLGPRVDVMLDYVERLTRDPSMVTLANVQALRDAGFGDVDILAIAEVTGYYAYANRIAGGLGVQLEPERSDHKADD